MTEMRSAGERHSFRPHLDGRPRAFTKMLYPFVKKLPKGHIDENQQQAASSMERQISG
jgi:hypothetical protein